MQKQPRSPESFEDYESTYRKFLSDVAEASPTLAEKCYLKGSAPASVQFFQHTFSMDADFQTKEVFDVDTILTVREELRESLGDRVKEFMVDGEYGSFMGALEMEDGSLIEIDLMSSFEDIDPSKFSSAGKLEGFDCVGKGEYIKAKAADCLKSRSEPKDLIHLASICSQDPAIDNFVKQGIGRISKDPDTAEALDLHLHEIAEDLANPREEVAELLSPKEGKRVADIDEIREFNQDLIAIVSENLEKQKEPEFSEESMEL